MCRSLILTTQLNSAFSLGRFISGLRQLTVPPHRRVTYAYGGRAFAVASRSVDVELTAETFTQPFLQLFCFWPSSLKNSSAQSTNECSAEAMATMRCVNPRFTLHYNMLPSV